MEEANNRRECIDDYNDALDLPTKDGFDSSEDQQENLKESLEVQDPRDNVEVKVSEQELADDLGCGNKKWAEFLAKAKASAGQTAREWVDPDFPRLEVMKQMTWKKMTDWRQKNDAKVLGEQWVAE